MQNQPTSRQITASAGSNLALSFVSLSAEKKHAMTVFYAYCRVADDIVDDKAKSQQEKRDDINFWRGEIGRCYADGEPSSALGKELRDIIGRHRIPQQPLLDLLDGVEMDIDKNRYANFDELALYCYRVASAVGLVSVEIFQYTSPSAREYAVALGMAFQLTNILRDVRFDYEKYGRVYLPRDELAAFGVSEETLLGHAPHPGRESLLRMQAFRAEHYFQKAARLFPHADRGNFVAAELMTEVYHRLLQRIRKNGCRLPAAPPRLNKWQKFLAARHARSHGAAVNVSGLRPPLKIAVIGGGYAGLSAAFHLAVSGHHSEVFEAKNFLGGRAHSFRDSVSGLTLDNSQHAFFGCYHSCLELLDTLGARHKLVCQDGIKVPYLSRNGSRSVLKAGDYPAPFHLLDGLLGFKALTARDCLAILKLGARLKFGGRPYSDENAGKWLRRLGQTTNAIRCLWEPFCLAALNEGIGTASAGLLYNTVKQCLLGSKTDSSVYLNKAGLSELLSPELDNFLRATGSKIHANRGVKEILFNGRAVSGLKLADDELITADIYISAMPFPALRALLPADSSLSAQLKNLKTSPILSVWLETDCPITGGDPFVALLDSPVQWIFNRGAADRHCHYLTISAAGQLIDTPGKELIDLLWAEINHYFPATVSGKILRHLIYKSRDATFASIPGVENFRPTPKTAWQNFFLAGDWTQTNLPATIEGAILSGKLAAQAISPLTFTKT
ncbi:MAG: hydroxysqualene dehydroxylase HpnE [Verrucomicrobiales bacterium]|jgi:squalene synthase HpnD|nr:hydroxysqualene dehydroxylase HpnE [Verrucomicrobiales bacterium]